jgi:lipoprotein NlpD
MNPMKPECPTVNRCAVPEAIEAPVVRLRWAVLGTLLVLAGCAARPPAPVVDRSTPAPAPVAQQQGAPSAGSARSGSATADRRAPSPGASSAQRPPQTATVQTAPVRSGQVESRPLSQAQAAQPSPQPVAPSVSSAPPPVTLSSETPSEAAPAPRPEMARPVPVSPDVVRTEPSGLKQPYSETALARARQGDAASAAARPPGPVAAAPSAAPSAARSETGSAVASTAAPARSAEESSSFAWPAPGKVLQPFADPTNMGIVIEGKAGEPVLAASDGRVIFSGTGPRGYGNLLIVKHDDDLLSVYGHNRALLVKEGDAVTRGQRIAEIGSSDAERAQLRFEIRRQGKPVDPMRYLAPR